MWASLASGITTLGLSLLQVIYPVTKSSFSPFIIHIIIEPPSKGHWGSVTLSFVERLSFSQGLKMY